MLCQGVWLMRQAPKQQLCQGNLQHFTLEDGHPKALKNAKVHLTLAIKEWLCYCSTTESACLNVAFTINDCSYILVVIVMQDESKLYMWYCMVFSILYIIKVDYEVIKVYEVHVHRHHCITMYSVSTAPTGKIVTSTPLGKPQFQAEWFASFRASKRDPGRSHNWGKALMRKLEDKVLGGTG